MITYDNLKAAGIKRYDRPGSVVVWKDSPDGKLRITELWGKNGAMIYKDHKGYYGLGKQCHRVDLSTINEAKIFVSS